ncbi:nucleoside diphosphatase (Ynd1), putative [Talaromyces stipitatus ATCC 10500]|uniref:Nucleoside diphosphatase (Ynd1), putative n=1 Tax=Talaromyces stipitatus (strain ATCC 10500 / CBS 375.48 / QM 6759 / NRRL 1006) TaxID=441959 RepID=B8LSW6_TALSN|nr:nucleoside diphosphatase (Ynd1), putative [Talaromyces stipitatus ATCC 10500]EED22962.1 nucleoside diphosphatase (Ynd1), putative [Talaromyces stipitatus ATCC 10500]
MGKWRYGVILDAGSSGTRVHIYRWLNNFKARQSDDLQKLRSLPEIKTKEEWTKKIKPGISTFADKPERVGSDHLDELLQHALDVVPETAVKDTPVFLLATAGMRLLSDAQRAQILNEVCSYFRSNSGFLLPECDIHIQVIPGETEGLYGWIAANYLLGSFDSPEDHAHGKDHHTYGFLDMGGASAQIAFVPNATETEKHANDLKLLRLRNVDGSTQEFRIFVTSWLEYGVREARRRFVAAIQESVGSTDVNEYPDPCLPRGLRTTLDGAIVDESLEEPHLLGTGRFDECLRQTYPLLDKDAPCADEPCLLHGIHVPAIDFDVNHFVGISEYWHTTHEIFEMGYKDKAYDFNTYQQRVSAFCSQDWGSINLGIAESRWGSKVDASKAQEVCFKASWIINMLHSGIGIPRVGIENIGASAHNGTKEVLQHGKEKGYLDPFQAIHKIDSTEVSWTLGKVVLYASSQVPAVEPDALPVGFGSNEPGIPVDFQYPSVELVPGPGPVAEESESWHDALFGGESPRRIPGLLLFVLIIVIALFFLCGRTRRSRLYIKMQNMFKRGGARMRRKYPGKLSFIGRNGPSYERVLEDGAAQFELAEADTDSDDDGYAADSDGISPAHSKRNSYKGSATGSQTPGLKFEFDNMSSSSIGLGIAPANVLDRQGLVVRTESREHLVPTATQGSRSRTVSPTRGRKSPMLKPVTDE